MKETITVGFSYGLIAKTLEEQAQEQGFTLGDKAEKLQNTLHSIHVIVFSDLVTGAQEKSILTKFNKKVIKNLRQK